MDEEYTAGFSEACAQCAEVNWGVSDEGHFFCRNCHNVIERTREVEDPHFTLRSRRASYISKGPKNKTEGGRQWFVCEGFQFILKNQAEALVKLGVNPRFKDEVLCGLWRQYLQKTHQAYTHTPVRSISFKVRYPESGDSMASSCESDGGNLSSAGSVLSALSAGDLSDWSAGSGSMDSSSYLSQQKKRSRRGLMTMKKTLALLHVGLVWSRQHLALSDLLRLVEQGQVPYVNAYECFPEEMKLSNKDALIFRVQSIPSYSVIHREARDLIRLLQLPAFPPISTQSPLHPLNLSLRYLTDLNLPDEMAKWVESLLTEIDLMDPSPLTVDPETHQKLPAYDLLAAAAIIVSMKLLFGLDDRTEWALSSEASSSESGSVFSFRRWYRLLQPVVNTSQRNRQKNKAKKQWIPKKPFYFTHKEKNLVMKRRRAADQLTSCFKRLSPHRHKDSQNGRPLGFCFLWGQNVDADGPSLHHMTLEDGARTHPTNQTYWLPPLRPCRGRCSSHFRSQEPGLPRVFVWILELVSLVLGVSVSCLYEAVRNLERSAQKRNTRRRIRTKTGTPITAGTGRRTSKRRNTTTDETSQED